MNTARIDVKQVLRILAKVGAAVVVFGLLSWCLEHLGGKYMSKLSTFVQEQGASGPLVFMAANALASMVLVPQVLFTVLAGALFGWKLGTVYASVAMTTGAVCSFIIARYGVRDWLRNRYKENAVYRKMQQLSSVHPLHVISLSRIIPVLPFPVTSYLLGITQVRSFPYALLTWACMLPETVFLASGGHLLHSGIVHGKAPWEVVVVLVVAGGALAVVVHRIKKKFLAEVDES